jgi:hypothetical protein
MRSRAALAVIVTAVVGLAALLVGRAFDERPLEQRLGVFITGPVAPLSPGHYACQGSIALADDTSAVTFNPGTPHAEPGPAIVVTVRDSYSQKTLSTGRLAAGFSPRKAQTVQLSPPVKANSQVDVCFRDVGPGKTLLFGDTELGSAHPSNSTSVASVDGHPLLTQDIAMVFPRAKPKSVLALVPEIFRRASLFRPGFVGPWVYWLLAALILVAAPLLLARALATAVADEHDAAQPDALRSRPSTSS